MSLFMCRWENGGCSFVAAPTKDVAVANRRPRFHGTFGATDEGKLQFQSFGELAENAIFEKAYPLLENLLHSDRLSDAAQPTERDLALIRATVAKERKRLQGKKRRRLAQTEIERRIAKRWMPRPH
jgi:hypothetical protein